MGPAFVLTIIIAVLLLALFTCAITTDLETIIVNHQARNLQVFREGIALGWVRACTVYKVEGMRPHSFGTVKFRFKDEEGRIVYETVGRSNSLEPKRRVYVISVNVPERWQNECQDALGL